MASKKILLVEGSDDKHVLKRISKEYGICEIDEISPCEGVSNLLENFRIRLKASDIEILGAVIDADIDLSARWNAIRDILSAAGYNGIPASPNVGGTIMSPPEGTILPKVGVWLMPDNQTPGILEDFLRFLVPTPSSLFDYAKQCIVSIPKEEVRFKEADKSKALIHTWLAWQKKPGKPLGLAITAHYLDHTVEKAAVLAFWLKNLFC